MKEKAFSVILLAGGVGSRMKSPTPKQVILLRGKPIAHYSLDVFLSMPETVEVIVVCEPSLRCHFSSYSGIKWALPGQRRQDSVYNGLQEVSSAASYVCVHDACRPFIDQSLVRRVLAAATESGASAAAMPLPYTIKEIDTCGTVVNTPDRTRFREIQTPQILERSLLAEGFKKAYADGLTVTDDTSLAELIGMRVRLVEGSAMNLKITSPDDLSIAEVFSRAHG